MSVAEFDSLNVNYQKRIKTLFNNVEKWLNKDIKINLNNLEWVDLFSSKLINYVEKTYSNKESQKSYLSAIAKVLENNVKKNKEINIKVAKLRQENYELECENKLDEKEQENYKTYNEIVEIRNNLKEDWENDLLNNTKNIKYLIVCLYSMTPPIRKEWIDMKIVDKKPLNKVNKINFLLKKDNGYELFIDNDKVSKTTKALKYSLPSVLVDVINKSLTYYPRDYVLSPPDRNKGNPLSYQRFNDMLVSMGLSIGNFRSAYITHMYNHGKLNLNMKKGLAKKMRHSLETAMCNYVKILPD